MAKDNTLLYIVIAVVVLLLLTRFGILGSLMGTITWLLNIVILVAVIYLLFLLIKKLK